ncbi:MAG: hypothetical protein V1799_09020 [bacterium]
MYPSIPFQSCCDGRAFNNALGFGISQSGRYLRHFLYDGFNADLKGRIVFDGLDAHVGGFSWFHIPFSRLQSERVKNHDPRPSLEERYKNEEHYLQLIDRSINDLVKRRFLLQDDAPALRDRARQYWKFTTTVQ